VLRRMSNRYHTSGPPERFLTQTSGSTVVRVLVAGDEYTLARVLTAARQADVEVFELEEAFRLRVADLEIDLMTRRATRGERRLDLTVREFDLLEYLLRHRGRLVSREMLARDVWKEPHRGTPLDNVIDVQMMRLRKKVDTPGGPRLIQTIRGAGFVLREGERRTRQIRRLVSGGEEEPDRGHDHDRERKPTKDRDGA